MGRKVNYAWTDEFTKKVITIFNREQNFRLVAEALGVGQKDVYAGFKRRNVEIVKIARFKNSL